MIIQKQRQFRSKDRTNSEAETRDHISNSNSKAAAATIQKQRPYIKFRNIYQISNSESRDLNTEKIWKQRPYVRFESIRQQRLNSKADKESVLNQKVLNQKAVEAETRDHISNSDSKAVAVTIQKQRPYIKFRNIYQISNSESRVVLPGCWLLEQISDGMPHVFDRIFRPDFF